LGGSAAALVAITWIAALSLDEPARKYMERKINARLTGYTIAVLKLHIHPWSVSLELIDSTLRQDANRSRRSPSFAR
jgi:hypothetical protein